MCTQKMFIFISVLSRVREDSVLDTRKLGEHCNAGWEVIVAQT